MRSFLRTRFDVGRVWTARHWRLPVSAALVVVAVVAFLVPRAELAIGAGSLAAAVAMLALDWRAHRDEDDDLVVAAAGRRDLSALLPGPSYAGAVVEQVEDGHLLRDDRVDDRLAELATTLRVNSPAHDVPPELAEVQLAVLRHTVKQGKRIFNGTVVRLETDLGRAAVEQGAAEPLAVDVRRTPFFAALGTNDLGAREVRSTHRRRTVVSGYELLADRGGRIRDLSQSWLANVIGISTLAVTDDRQLLVVRQTPHNTESGDRLAPSGSGSVDAVDLAGATDLQALVVGAMERELREECCLPAKTALSTRLTGFARWLERGGKPEFYGVTAVGMTAREVELRRVDRSERDYVAYIETFGLGDDLATALEGIGPRLAERGPVSIPLTAALNALRRALAADPLLLDRLRGGG
jgi:hypothetical protein